MQMSVVRLRRYPVKSMAGEALDAVELDARGLVGDRWFAVVDGDGHFASGKNTRRFRRRDAVFDYAARTSSRGDVVVSGAAGQWQVGEPALDDHLTAAMGTRVAVRPEGQVPHQDESGVSLVTTATLAWCRERWGIDADPRRLRTNIVIDADEPFVEESWVGREVAIGAVRLRITKRVPRCRMIDVPQDGATAAGNWLKPLAERDLCVAVYADVVRPGAINLGAALTVVR